MGSLVITRTSIIRAVVVLAMGLLPVYLGPSGSVQLAHAVLAIASMAAIANFGVRLNRAELALMMLLLVVVAREFVSVLQGLPVESLLSAAYLAFNLLVVSALRRLIGNGDARFVCYGLSVALVVAVAGVVLIGSGGKLGSGPVGVVRSIGTFNNPNQLGYFAICSFSIAVLLFVSGKVRRRYLVWAVTASVFLAVASLSKAAMVSVFVPSVLVVALLIRGKKYVMAGVGLSGLIGIVCIAFILSGWLDDIPAVQRLQLIGLDSDDSLHARGYTVLAEMGPMHVFFGFASAGVITRVGHEVHSTIFSMVASFGAVGGGIFVWFILEWFRVTWRSWGAVPTCCVWLPAMLYGLTHNGTRFTIFWILVGLTFAFAAQQSNTRLSYRSYSGPHREMLKEKD